MSWRSGRLLFTASAASRQSRDLTVRAPGCRSGRLRPLSQWRLVPVKMWSRTEGSGSRACRLCAIQTRSHYAQGKSCSLIFLLFAHECVKGRERVVSVSITIITRTPSPGGLHDPQSSWFSLYFYQLPPLYAGFLSLFFCLFERERDEGWSVCVRGGLRVTRPWADGCV